MKELWGQTEQAFRDTLVHKAERRALERLGVIYGFERPKTEVSEKAYQSALSEAAYAKRGTKESMFDVIEASMSDYNVTYSSLTYNDSLPDRLFTSDWASLSADADELALKFLYRYIRTNFGVHLVVRTEFQVTVLGNTCSVLHLCPTSHLYYAKLDPGESVTLNIYLLPMVIRETTPGPIDEDGYVWSPGEPCVADLLITDVVANAPPPTYLLADGDEDTPVGMPYGGQLLTDSNVDGNPVGIGPHPIYLYDGGAFGGLTKQLNRLVVFGNEVRIIREPG